MNTSNPNDTNTTNREAGMNTSNPKDEATPEETGGAGEEDNFLAQILIERSDLRNLTINTKKENWLTTDHVRTGMGMYTKTGESTKNIAVTATFLDEKERGDERKRFLYDDGSNENIINNERYLFDMRPIQTFRRITTVEDKSNTVTLATHVGRFKFATPTGVIEGQAYLADIKTNIFSPDKLVQALGKSVRKTIKPNGEAFFTVGQDGNETRYELDNKIPHNIRGFFLKRDSLIIKELEGEVDDIRKTKNKRDPIATVCMTRLENAIMTHNRLGHWGADKINATIDHECIQGAKRMSGQSTRYFCPICNEAKMTKQPKLKTKHCEMVSEVVGSTFALDRMEFPVTSIDGATSAIIVIDIAAKYAWAIPTSTKTKEEFIERVLPTIIKRARQATRNGDLTADKLTLYLRDTNMHDENEGEANPYRLLRFRSDNEFANPEMKDMFENQGFLVQTTAAHDSASNPFAEIMIRRLRESIRTYLCGAAMPDIMWTDALAIAITSHNQMSHSSMIRRSRDKSEKRYDSPIIRMTGKKPKFDYIHVPFAPTWCWVNPEGTKVNSLGMRGVEAIYVGNDEDDEKVIHVRITSGKTIKELLETGDELFKKIVKVHHVLVDEWFQSCRNGSPYHKQFIANKE